MKQELLKENKKTGIVCLGTRISLSSKNVRSVDFVYTRDYLQNVLGRDVDFISLRTKKEDELDYYKDIYETDLNDYDELFIYNYSQNPFGGVFGREAIETFKKLYDYNGDIYYLLYDPKMPSRNFAEYLKKRLKDKDGDIKVNSDIGKEHFTVEYLTNWSNKVFPKIKVAFAGVNYPLYYETYNNGLTKRSKDNIANIITSPDNGWIHIPIFEYYAVNEDLDLKLKDYPYKDKRFDLVYYGNNRMTDRTKVINKLYNDDELSKLFIGYDPKFSNTESMGYVKHDELFETMGRNCYATVVVGDKLHNNNTKTPRFYEAMLLDVVAFIYTDFDKDKTYVKNDELKEFIYVSTKDELKEKLNKIKNDEAYYKHIVQLERNEVINVCNKYNMEDNY